MTGMASICWGFPDKAAHRCSGSVESASESAMYCCCKAMMQPWSKRSIRWVVCLSPSGDPGFPTPKRSLLAPALFAVGIGAAAFGLMPVQIAFATTCIALILFNAISLRDAYRSIQWPIIILLGCLIPIGEALHTTGGTQLISDNILRVSDGLPLWVVIALLIGVSMLLSDLIHNSPTAVLMAPLAISLAEGMQVSPDPLLMAVAVGAASAYLTPIGHQSNTLVMGPGGYRFGDYWHLGLPLDLVILCVAVPMIVQVWS